MNSKALIYTLLTVGGLVGGFLGGILDNGNMFGLWSFLLGFVGGIAGIWLGYRLSR